MAYFLRRYGRIPVRVVLLEPIACTHAAFSVLLFSVVYSTMSGSIFNCFTAAAAGIFGAFAGILPFFVSYIGKRRLFVMLLLHAASLILVFAAIYRGFGLREHPYVTWDLALYFSVETWTTLGYGDFQPAAGIELIAAAQAIVGYTYLGMIVAVLGAALILQPLQEEDRL
ncbi:ion channel [Rhizobium beringeri]